MHQPGGSSGSRSRSSTTSSTSALDVPSAIILGEQIGRGTYGRVFAAEYLGKKAAVKAVPVEPGPDGQSLCADLQREIRILKKCDSPWIVRYHGCLTKNFVLWIAMELCDGSVADVLRVTREPLREDEIAAVVASVVRGLVHLHDERKILHRDIKAGNVLLSGGVDGGIKLCDLGVSASVANHTKRSTVIGTPLWMSPEVINACGGYGTPTDIWSLGITAIEMAQVHAPYSDINPPIRALFLITSMPAARLANPSAWSADLVDFVERTLQKEVRRACVCHALACHALACHALACHARAPSLVPTASRLRPRLVAAPRRSRRTA